MSDPLANRYVVSEFYRSYRLDRYIQAMIPKLSRSKIQTAIRTRVRVSWHPRARASMPVLPGGEVTILFPDIVEPEIAALPRIVFEDDAILVVDKPAGLLVHPTHSCRLNSLIHLLRADRPEIPLSLAHRLDRDTSGLILLSRTVEAARTLAGLFERREIGKTYLAIVHGRITPPSGRIDASLGVSQHLQVIFKRSVDGRGAQRAVTDYRVLVAGDDLSLLELTPHTGRRHQLRAHLAAIGHPIAGDKLYGLSSRDYLKHLRGRLGEAAHRAMLADRQLLHAHRLHFAHPRSGLPVEFLSHMPEDMTALLASHGLAVPRSLLASRGPDALPARGISPDGP